MNKDTKIYLTLGIIVILITIGIYYWKNSSSDNKPVSEEIMKCIAEKSVMYSQTSCSHCIQQKEILGNYTKLFNIIECDKSREETKKCLDEGITGTPTWIINKEKAEGIQSIKQLRELTGC